jgi:hypothetical protein
MHQVSDQVVLLVFRHACPFSLNLLERHIQVTLGAGLPKSKREKQSLRRGHGRRRHLDRTNRVTTSTM